MNYKRVYLKELYNTKYDSYFEIYSPEFLDFENPYRPLVIVVPGGGYEMISKREKDPVVLEYLRAGYNVASITYTNRTMLGENDNLYPLPHLDLMYMIDYIKTHAPEHLIDKDRIALVGFSAGGHLAGSFPYVFKDLLHLYKGKNKDLKPQVVVLSYPVINMKESSETNTRKNITNFGKEELEEFLSIEKHIDPTYPKTYIWCTEDDDVVPSINTKMMVEQLKKNNVIHQYHIFKSGPHGLSTCDENVLDKNTAENFKDIKAWTKESIEFLKNNL